MNTFSGAMLVRQHPQICRHLLTFPRYGHSLLQSQLKQCLKNQYHRSVSTEAFKIQEADQHVSSVDRSAVHEDWMFRTQENDPNSHNWNHVGLHYRLPDDAVKNLFGMLSLPNRYFAQVKTFNEACLMVRESAVDIISHLRCIDSGKPAVRFVLYGETGTSKTFSLAHLMHWAYSQGCCLVHVPNTRRWTIFVDEVVTSTQKPQQVDLPLVSAEWLKRFRMQNSRFFDENEVKTSRDYVWSKRETTESGSPLIDVVEHGINRVKYASDCVNVVFRELKLQSSAFKKPVLITVDGVNQLFYNSAIKREDKTELPSGDISIVNGIKKLMKNDWTNAAVVVTVDERNEPPRPFTGWVPSVFPRHLLTKQGFELLDPFLPVLTKNFSEKEGNSVLEYFIDRNWIQNPASRTEAGKKELLHVSGFNPRQLELLCRAL